jgi:hypothetical protein
MSQISRAGVLSMLAVLAPAACDRDEPTPAPPAIRESIPARLLSVGGIQVRETETPGVVADLLTASRAEGYLTIAVRVRNTGTDTVRFAIPSDGGTYPSVRLEADGRFWSIARDEAGSLQAPGDFDRALDPGESMLWRAVFEAPPRSVTSFDLSMPGLRVPFQDIPITEEPAEGIAPQER